MAQKSKAQTAKSRKKTNQSKKKQQERSRSGASHKGEPPKISLAPMLSVRKGAKAVEFYKAAFGARELFRVEAPDGAVVAQLAVGESDFWVADESPENKNFSPETLGGATTRMVLVLGDPDAAHAKAVKAGAAVVTAVEDQPYGWRVGRVVDPYGHHWEIGKPL
jgi:PhnB protein